MSLCESRARVQSELISFTRFSRELPAEHLEGIGPFAVLAECGRRLITAVDHAMLAALIFAPAILRPVGLVHEIIKLIVMFVGDQVAGALPAFDVARRV